MFFFCPWNYEFPKWSLLFWPVLTVVHFSGLDTIIIIIIIIIIITIVVVVIVNIVVVIEVIITTT